MKQEVTWGAAGVLALAAAIGISSQSGTRPRENASITGRRGQTGAETKAGHPHIRSACADLIDLFHAFLLQDVRGPAFCYPPDESPRTAPDASQSRNLQPRFVIATFPDPLHTHFSLLFDRFVEAAQQAAQDEGYEYDSSWLPWEMEEPTLITLQDQDDADERKKRREEQPGVLLFHLGPDSGQAAGMLYQKSLVVFVVGEDPTDGIHRKQFLNAMKWVSALEADARERGAVAVLGPTFSGSFTSLAELLEEGEIHENFRGRAESSGKPLAIYSGSTTDNQAARWFSSVHELEDLGISFHSFLQDDDTALSRLCTYLQGPGRDALDLGRLAILSEDETAYGYAGPSATCKGAPRFYYPRDISSLRAAYQKQSIFSFGTADQSAKNSSPPRSLRTDLADPAGKEHDTVPTYAGNQTPLSQEAQLLGIVAALRTHQSEYIVLRSSNTLDPLFLANFLRREYPEGRVVVLNSDLLYQRGQDAMAIGGVMTLSTYPLFPSERHWTVRPHSAILAHRVFPENSTEGTYNALRLLLQAPVFMEDPSQANCHLADNATFLPSIACRPEATYVPIPDYAPPFWTGPPKCEENGEGTGCRPATWLSVIKRNSSWPLAALNTNDVWSADESQRRNEATGGSSKPKNNSQLWPPMPLSMKVSLTLLLIFSIFHLACCRFASFTSKPAFRAHFATRGWRHRVLIFFGSVLIVLMALIMGWGCGAFSWADAPMNGPWCVFALIVFVWLLAGLSIITNAIVTYKLNESECNHQKANHNKWLQRRWLFLALLFLLSIGASFRTWVVPLEKALNLTNRVPAYWRSMNIVSGVSPITPFLLLLFGLYLWFWYELHGLALFGPDRQQLPRHADLMIVAGDSTSHRAGRELDVLPMFSQECAGDPTENVATPLASGILWVLVILLFALAGFALVVFREVPLRSLGAKVYAKIFCLWFDFCASLIIAAAWQLWRTWSRLRQLLVFLDRLPLRRTLAALRGFSWGTVWKMSGNVLDVRYKILSRQLESLNHLQAALARLLKADARLDAYAREQISACLAIVDECRDAGIPFAEWYSNTYNNPDAAGLRRLDTFQQKIAFTAGHVLTGVLIPSWRKERQSLILTAVPDLNNNKDGGIEAPTQSPDEHIRNAEEFTCLTYLAFTQNILGRIRTIALGGLFLFVATTLGVTSYPFDPRPLLGTSMLMLFVAFGAVVVFVYADMHRDPTLSHITNTNPGELGSEFWFKIIGFGAAPVLSLLTAIFPELSQFFFSWLQPGLTSLK